MSHYEQVSQWEVSVCYFWFTCVCICFVTDSLQTFDILESTI